MLELVRIELDDHMHDVDPEMTVAELLSDAAPDWLEHGIGVRLNEVTLDFHMPLRNSGHLALINQDTDPDHVLEVTRHTTSHVMAQAVQQLFDNVKVGIGPPTQDGFYYDFLREMPFTPEDLERIEARMTELISADQPLSRLEIPRDEALRIFEEKGETLKCELIRDKGGPMVSCYQQGEFIDFCTGPHLPSTGRIPVTKLLSTAAAHWRGRDDFPMLQRIYGTAFLSTDSLEQHLAKREEARRRDHRRLGTDLDLFHIDEKVGAGLVLWHPKGSIVRSILEDYLRTEHTTAGYHLAYTPHIARKHLWEQSGHYDYYRENMYTLDVDGQEYVLKPMNCPGHILIFKQRTRSYRELPFRLAEFGTVYRHERSGVMHGMLRVRGFTQDDAHIFCTRDQVSKEILSVLQLGRSILSTLGFQKYDIELSVRDPNNRGKYAGNDDDWELGEAALISALEAERLEYTRMEGEAVFYGPKIDIQVMDAIGRKWQCSTIQLDFTLPQRFDIRYVGDDSQEHRVIMVHRALLGSIERFFGMLTEHFAGVFPLWLAPVQATIIPIADRHLGYANQVAEKLRSTGLRVELDARSGKMGAKIRDAQMQKIPFMLIVGDRETKNNQLAVRHRAAGDLGALGIDEFCERTLKDIRQRAICEWPVADPA